MSSGGRLPRWVVEDCHPLFPDQTDRNLVSLVVYVNPKEQDVLNEFRHSEKDHHTGLTQDFFLV